jgi:hypothetical protein
MSDPAWLAVERQWLEVQKTIDAVIANLGGLVERAASPHPSIKPIDGEVIILVRILLRALLDAMRARRIAAASSPLSGGPDAPRPDGSGPDSLLTLPA